MRSTRCQAPGRCVQILRVRKVLAPLKSPATGTASLCVEAEVSGTPLPIRNRMAALDSTHRSPPGLPPLADDVPHKPPHALKSTTRWLGGNPRK